MNNENVICKTECKHKRLVTIPAIIWWILCVISFFPTFDEWCETEYAYSPQTGKFIELIEKE